MGFELNVQGFVARSDYESSAKSFLNTFFGLSVCEYMSVYMLTLNTYKIILAKLQVR